MFEEMRRSDRGLDEAATAAILAKGLYGVLSLQGDEYPYGVPLSFVYDGGVLYFHCALDGKKLGLMRRQPKAAFCVVSEAVPLTDARSMRYESAMVFGTLGEVTDEAEKLAALLAIVARYAGDEQYMAAGREQALNSLAKTAVFKMTVNHMTGKARR
jgi:nitroimidazol reductase NimA-like FMN-containing flavoprotein (pyridoxamine 5'-phosphate oxidase superfamily)